VLTSDGGTQWGPRCMLPKSPGVREDWSVGRRRVLRSGPRSVKESGNRREWTGAPWVGVTRVPDQLDSGWSPKGGEGVRGARLGPPDSWIRMLPLLVR
jgi:hypothetical protein